MSHPTSISTAAAVLILIPSLSGCIRSEAPNAEADIVRCTLPAGYIINEDNINYNASFKSSVQAYPLDITVNDDVRLDKLAPQFQLTPGATIEPASGSIQNFTEPVRYTVTSEDGQWQRPYLVSIVHKDVVQIPDFYTFDNYITENSYHVMVEGSLQWCSGNGGFKLTGAGTDPLKYPTSYFGQGRTNGCVKMQTLKTGSLGESFGKPLAAGSLHMGSFDIIHAVSDALKSTRFGVSYTHIPDSIVCWYKYVSGPEFYEPAERKYIPGKKDFASISAIFFESTDEEPMLDAYITTPENNWSHKNMVAVARVAEIGDTEEWTRISIPFDYKRFSKQIDPAKLEAGVYKISIIMSSSTDGGNFRGAPGSIFLVDDMQIVNHDVKPETEETE